MRVWRMSLQRTKSAIIAWHGSIHSVICDMWGSWSASYWISRRDSDRVLSTVSCFHVQTLVSIKLGLVQWTKDISVIKATIVFQSVIQKRDDSNMKLLMSDLNMTLEQGKSKLYFQVTFAYVANCQISLRIRAVWPVFFVSMTLRSWRLGYPSVLSESRGGSRIFGSGVQISWGGRFVKFDQLFLKFPKKMK